MIDLDDDFSAGVIEHITGASIDNCVLSFTMVDFTINSNTYFAIAKKPSFPRTIINNRRATYRVSK